MNTDFFSKDIRNLTKINGQRPKRNDNVGWMQVLDNAAEILAIFWDKTVMLSLLKHFYQQTIQ